MGVSDTSLDASSAAVNYLGRTLTRAEVTAHADAVAAYLVDSGVGPGGRVLLQLQNTPHAVITCMAAWKLGAVVVPVNPMYKADEVSFILGDCRPAAAIVLGELAEHLPVSVSEESTIPLLIASADDYAGADFADSDVPRPTQVVRGKSRHENFREIVEAAQERIDTSFDRSKNSPGDIAAIVYTSGTTGPPKGAMILHRNLTTEVSLWRDVYQFRRGDAIMGVAPFFHVTGLVADLTVALDCGVPLVYSYRFDPVSALRWIEYYRPTSMVAAITAYVALLNQPSLKASDVESLRTCLSGGAPVSSATVEWWRQKTGHYIRNCYGLTETTSLVTVTPADVEAPTDRKTGALSVGRAVRNTNVEIRDDGDRPLGPDAVGEVVVAGPQLVAGYWEKEAETASAFGGGALHTGDVGFLDRDGWLYLIDRRKDLIVTSGYKVWPREVEDMLLRHPAVREAGVIGGPDAYRGEQVVAYVSLKRGKAADAAELIDFCRERIAAFKAPRQVLILEELPKTPTGKILRRELRALSATTQEDARSGGTVIGIPVADHPPK
jgi:long-chain acyl-CoA synthetase